MLTELKKDVCQTNIEIFHNDLVKMNWGNASGIDRGSGLVVIKPSGISFNNLTFTDMVVVDMDGNVVDGKWKPSTDTPTHLELYRNFPDIGGIVHTHSRWATAFAQAGSALVPYGTTHADFFYGSVPCTRAMNAKEILSDYELNTGRVIVETFKNINPNDIPAVLVRSHGPFSWGKTPADALKAAIVLEEIAFLNFHTRQLAVEEQAIGRELLDRHFLRKHGSRSYYGQ